MENQMFTGIGCFAKPGRLGLIFSRLVQDYALGPFEDHDLFGKDMSTQNEGADLLQAFVGGRIGGGSRRSGGYETVSFQTPKRITGFYLCLKDQKLNLSIFARGNSPGQEVYTTSLDGLTKLRRKRLN